MLTLEDQPERDEDEGETDLKPCIRLSERSNLSQSNQLGRCCQSFVCFLTCPADARRAKCASDNCSKRR